MQAHVHCVPTANEWDADFRIIHIYTHNAFADLELLWKRNVDGPCDENIHSGSWFIQSQQATAALSETILHKPNKLSDWPTFGLGLDLTNWIMAQSSFYNAKQTADKDNRHSQRL